MVAAPAEDMASTVLSLVGDAMANIGEICNAQMLGKSKAVWRMKLMSTVSKLGRHSKLRVRSS